MSIKSFKRKSSGLQRFTRKKPGPKKRFDGSPRERGYDSIWAKLSKRYRASVNHLCEECARRGIVNSADVVDHMVPIADDGTRRLDFSNLDALCHNHHNGFKRRVEDYARKTGQVQMIPIWMKNPETRPLHFRFKKNKSEVIDGVVYNRLRDCETVDALPLLIDARDCPSTVYNGPCRLVSATNHTDQRVTILDGPRSIQMLEDGQSLQNPIIIQTMLIFEAKSESGKISLAYVENDIV